jgi:hypothetical protein
VLRWGEAHFDRDGSKRFLYARVLFSCQLFREGIAHLAKVGREGQISEDGVMRWGTFSDGYAMWCPSSYRRTQTDADADDE